MARPALTNMIGSSARFSLKIRRAALERHFMGYRAANGLHTPGSREYSDVEDYCDGDAGIGKRTITRNEHGENRFHERTPPRAPGNIAGLISAYGYYGAGYASNHYDTPGCGRGLPKICAGSKTPDLTVRSSANLSIYLPGFDPGEVDGWVGSRDVWCAEYISQAKRLARDQR
jgi:hypothetical protein